MICKKKLLFLAICLTALVGCQDTARRTGYAELRRDDFGVPHIFAETEIAAAYAHGYAQAEDRLEQILRQYRWAEGTLAEAFGKAYLDSDYQARMWRHAEISRKKFDQIPAHTRAVIEAFVAGIKAYMAEHPAQVPDWAPEVKAWQVVALTRAFIWSWPEEQARADLERRFLKPKQAKVRRRGSNQWALAGVRTASGAPMLLIDPHLPWDGAGKWTEVRIHAEDLTVAGMVVPGLPYVMLGHNREIAWAATTGGPDCGDIFAIETEVNDPLRYRVDKTWYRMTVDSVRLDYTEAGERKFEIRTIERSHLGPIVLREYNRAYAMAIPYENEVLLIETLARINKAKSIDEFRAALAAQQFPPQNMLAADVDGDLYYERTGRVPIRPEGFDYSRPVSGNTAATAWQGIHPTRDLVHLRNPAAGYLQNCNIAPDAMLDDGSISAADYPVDVFNDRPRRSNARGRRVQTLLKNARQIDVAAAQRIVFDATADATEISPWQSALQLAFNRTGKREFPALREAVLLINRWNHSFSTDNTSALLYYKWRARIQREQLVSLRDIRGRRPKLMPAAQRALLQALQAVANELQTQYGRLEVPWGDYMRIQRGEVALSLAGNGFDHLGMSTLRSLWGSPAADGKSLFASGGQSCPMLVILTRPIKSYSILPFGISDDPVSPHYADQMGLFSQEQLKPTYFDRKALQGHLTSTREFRPPVPARSGS